MRLIRTPLAQGHIQAPVRAGIAWSAGVPPAHWRDRFAEGSGFRVQGGAGILPGDRERPCQCPGGSRRVVDGGANNRQGLPARMRTTHVRSGKRSAERTLLGSIGLCPASALRVDYRRGRKRPATSPTVAKRALARAGRPSSLPDTRIVYCGEGTWPITRLSAT